MIADILRALADIWSRLLGRLNRPAVDAQRLAHLERDIERYEKGLDAAAEANGRLQEVDARLGSIEGRIDALTARCTDALAAVAHLEGLLSGWGPPAPPNGRRRKGR